MSNNDKQVYISYAWKGESERIANELDTNLQANGIAIIRDKRELGFKGMIQDFMQRIGRGHAVIVIISDKYLKSSNCMYELVEIAKNKDIYNRIFPIVLGDADIYNPVNRIKYIKYWEDKLKELDEAMKSVSSANLQGMRDEIDSYDEIRDNISNLTFLLKDMNTLTPEMHEGSDFAVLISSLKQRLGEEVVSDKPAVKNSLQSACAKTICAFTNQFHKRLPG
jgi:internalin A